jgi:hypothetical protein
MRTKFLIRQNKWFIKGHILRGTFPLPDGMTTDILENRVNEMSDTSVLDMYYYVDDSALPLHKGDRVMMGEFSWYVHDTVFDYNNNNLIYTLVR